MGTPKDALRTIVEDETRFFCDAEQYWQEQKGALGRTFRDTTMHAKLTNCGVATALLQSTLDEHYGIQTERYISHTITPLGKPFDHVILRHESFILDPTFRQLSTCTARLPIEEKPDTAPHENNTLSLVIDTASPQDTLSPHTAALASIDHTHHEAFFIRSPVCSHLSGVALRSWLHDLYNDKNLSRFEIDQSHLSYDRILSLQKTAKTLRDSRLH